MLKAHGVEILFGLCGDTSLPFYDALARLPHGMRHILARDERSAAYMADGYARVSGKVGVCEGPSGGGVTYILPGLAEANESSVPLLCINSRYFRQRARPLYPDRAGSRRAHASGDEMEHGARPRRRLPRAFRAAFKQITTGRPGAAHIALPFDVQNGAVESSRNLGRAKLWPLSGRARCARCRIPSSAPLDCCARRRDRFSSAAAASMISGAEAGAARARRAAFGAGRDHHQRQRIDQRRPSACRRRRRLQRRHAGDALDRRSSRSDYFRRLPRRLGDHRALAPSRAGTKQKSFTSTSTPQVPGANYPADAALVGDAKLAFKMLNRSAREHQAAAGRSARAKQPRNRNSQNSRRSPSRPKNRSNRSAWWPRSTARSIPMPSSSPTPARPARIFRRTIKCAAPAGAFSPTAPTARSVIRWPPRWARISRSPQVKCVSVMGDGSFGFTCGELETAARYRLPITFIVISNASYGWIKAGQKSGYGAALLRRGFRRHRSRRRRRRLRRQELARDRARRIWRSH